MVVATIVGGVLAIAGPAHATTGWWVERTGSSIAVNGTYIPIVGNFNGGPQDDIIWYAPGSGTESLWTSSGSGAFTKTTLSRQVSGTFTPIVGDFAGDARSDIFWYAPGAATDYLWITNSGTFTQVTETVSGTYQPFVVPDTRYQLGSNDDIVWYAPGSGADAMWVFTGSAGAHTSRPLSIPGSPRALVGDFDGNHIADVFWYNPGTAADTYWRGTDGGGTFLATTFFVNGTYQPVVGDFSETPDGRTDIMWFRSGTASDSLWFGSAGAGFNHVTPQITGTGTAIAVWSKYGRVFTWDTAGPDRIWERLSPSDLDIATRSTEIPAGYTPIVGNWSDEGVTGSQGIFWYQPGSAPEFLFL